MSGIATGEYFVEEPSTEVFKAVKIIGNENINNQNNIMLKRENKVTYQENENAKVNSDIRKDKIQFMNKESQSNPLRNIKRREIEEIIGKNNKMSDIEKYQNGELSRVIIDLSDYLKVNKDTEVQKYLENILNEFDNIYATDLINENIGENKKYNPTIFDSLTYIYKDGIKNEKENVLSINPDKYKYYMYILRQTLGNDNTSKIKISEQRKQEIKEIYKD